jgi:hypothetical protein
MIYPEPDGRGRGNKGQTAKLLETSSFSRQRLDQARKVFHFSRPMAEAILKGIPNAASTSRNWPRTSMPGLDVGRKPMCRPRNRFLPSARWWKMPGWDSSTQKLGESNRARCREGHSAAAGHAGQQARTRSREQNRFPKKLGNRLRGSMQAKPRRRRRRLRGCSTRGAGIGGTTGSR